mgnify:CR=1 FL=1
MRLYAGMQATICLPDEPGKVVAFAGEELAKYLKKIFGEKVCISGELAQITFSVGITDALSGPEGFSYRIQDNTVSIAGSDGTGALYGVYTFLERELGCCFGVFPIPEKNVGEVVPVREEIFLEDTYYCKMAADLPYRTSIAQFSEWVGNVDRGLTVPFIDYLAKNRYNRILTWIGVYL